MTQGELLGGNLYAYCGNCPVNMVDNNGHLPKWITDFTRGFIDGFGNAAKGLLNAFLQPLQTLKSILSLKNFISGWFSGLTIGWSILFKIVKGDFYNAGVLYGGHIFQAVVVLITYGAVKVAGKIKTMLTSTSLWGNLSKAAQYGLKPYYTLKTLIKNTGLQAHHIIEKRFGLKGLETDISVALTKTEHQLFTNAWRKKIPYGTQYTYLTINEIWAVAQQVYANFPVLLEAARKALGK